MHPYLQKLKNSKTPISFQYFGNIPSVTCSQIPYLCIYYNVTLFIFEYVHKIIPDTPLVRSELQFNNKFSKLQVLTHGLFSTMGQIKHTPIITYHQIDDTNQSIRVKFYYYSAIYFCAKKKEKKYQKKEKKIRTCFMKKNPHQSICSKRKLRKKLRKKKKKTFLELQ